MAIKEKENLLEEIKPLVKDMVNEIVVESIKKGEMTEIIEDIMLARAMEETEKEENLSYDEALKQVAWK